MWDPDTFSKDPIRRYTAQLRNDSSATSNSNPTRGGKGSLSATFITVMLGGIYFCAPEEPKYDSPMLNEIDQITNTVKEPVRQMQLIQQAKDKNRTPGEVKDIQWTYEQKSKFPPVALAFSPYLQSIRARSGNTIEEAKKKALNDCKAINELIDSSRYVLDPKCAIISTLGKGTKGCITYSSVKSHTYKQVKINTQGKVRGRSIWIAFSGVSLNAPKPSNNAVLDACHGAGALSSDCYTRAKAICNFDFSASSQAIEQNVSLTNIPTDTVSTGWNSQAKDDLMSAWYNEDKNAIYNISTYYAEGLLGVDRNLKQAEIWAKVGAQRGHAPSQKLLNKLTANNTTQKPQP